VNQAYLGLASWGWQEPAGIPATLSIQAHTSALAVSCSLPSWLLSNVHDSVIDVFADEPRSYRASQVEEIRCSQEPGFQHA